MKQGFLSYAKARLSRPYVMESRAARRWMTCLLYSSFVFMFLFVFRPFGLSTLPNGMLTISLGYGLTTFAVMALLNIALPPLFPLYFSEPRWTVGREIAWATLNIAVIGLANLLYSRSIHFFSFSFGSLLLMEGFTLAIGIFPVSISTLAKEARLKKRYEQRSEQINTALKEHLPAMPSTPAQALITIPAETRGDDFSLSPDELLYMRAADNYVDVFYRRQQAIERRVIRNSLKSIAEALQEHPALFRCHKSYLVNLDRVSHVSGNAQGYKLHLPDVEVLIPVSRQWNDAIRTRLAGSP